MVEKRIPVGGPYFEDFEIGQVFDGVPGVTLTEGHAALPALGVVPLKA